MGFVSQIHTMLGYSLVLILLVESLWTLSEVLMENDPGTVSTVKSKIVVGLVDLQALLGLINAWVHYPLYRIVHAVTMIAAVGLLHVAAKKTKWTKFGFQIASLILVVLGIGFLHMLR